MDILSSVKNRRSIRDFQKKEIADDLLDKLAEALIWAPSAGNLQARKFYFVKNARVRKMIASEALKQNFIGEAPLVVIGCTDSRISNKYGDRGVYLYSVQDVAASIMCMMLVAHEHGLGSVWVGAFREEGVCRVLDLPAYLRPVAVVPVGYPSRVPDPPPRISKKEAMEVIE
jgi:nitroreductase